MTDITALTIAKNEQTIALLPKMANRHGLVAGATGTGKTVTLQGLAEAFSRIGVPVFLSDIKGDLSGMASGGGGNRKVNERIIELGLEPFTFEGYPVVFWDVFGRQGHAVRTTVSEMGPLLLSRLLNLNETQSGVLQIIFKIADDRGLLLLDLKDLRAMTIEVGENAKEYTTTYGNVSRPSVGAIQRSILTLEEQGGDVFFGEPALDILDWLRTDPQGRGYVNLLASDQLFQSPALYATFLLWLLSELYEQLPEVGDLDKPKLVFFFDEAHILFGEAPKVLLDKVEQVVRLIRSKGVGIFFITQNPIDIPDKVLGQLGNRVQHALRAYTPRDQKAVKAAAETFRINPKVDVATEITELAVGEALISCLDKDGRPSMVERAFVLPPHSQIGPIPPELRQQLVAQSPLAGKYDRAYDRHSAYEALQPEAAPTEPAPTRRKAETPAPQPKKTTRKKDNTLEKMANSAVTSIGREIGRQLIRGLMGSLTRR